MAILKKLTMYVCDLEGNLSTDILHQMIDTYVLGRSSTNGFCLLKEEKSKDIEWSDDYPLNYCDKSDDPNEWEKCLDNEQPILSQESANCDKFTLTPEEVDVAEVVFNRFLLDLPDLKAFIIEYPSDFAIINNICNRILKYKYDSTDKRDRKEVEA